MAHTETELNPDGHVSLRLATQNDLMRTAEMLIRAISYLSPQFCCCQVAERFI